MSGSSNFIQWNNTGANQVGDSAYATAAGTGCQTDSIFASNVANKIFYQVSTFITALANALANQGLTLSDSNLTTLTAVLTNIVVSGVGSNPTLGNVTCNTLDVASITSSTGIECYGGIQSGETGVTQGLYAITDSSFVIHNGYTGPISGRSAIGGLVV